MRTEKEWPYGQCPAEQGYDDNGYWFCGTKLIDNDYCPVCDIHWNRKEEPCEPMKSPMLFDFENNMVLRKINTTSLITEGVSDNVEDFTVPGYRPLEIWAD